MVEVTESAVADAALPDAERAYDALRAQIVAAYGDRLDDLAIAGIRSGGAWLAERLVAERGLAPHGVINVGFHRDDYASKGLHAQASPTRLPFDVNGRDVLLLDDVLNTGRTTRAALNELFDFGRPASVVLAVLADRGGRELPIAASFVGMMLDASLSHHVKLVLTRQPDGTFVFATEARGD